jgi:hypothetical protein
VHLFSQTGQVTAALICSCLVRKLNAATSAISSWNFRSLFVGSKSVGVLTGYLAGFAVSRLTMYGDSLDKFHMIKVKETGMKNESIIMIRQLV